MYKCYQDKMAPGKESFPLAHIIGENLLYLATWVLAGALLWPVWLVQNIPVLTLLWALLVIVVQVVLKKHNCSGCYYYDKRCHLGWGKLSSALFKPDSGNPETGKKLTLFYIVPPPVIVLTSLAFAVTQKPEGYYWIVLLAYLVLNAASFPVRKKGCGLCTMRKVCPGSAVKK